MMIHLFPEQLEEKLTKKWQNFCYVLFGNDTFLLNDTKDLVLKHMKSCNSYEFYNFPLNNKSPWNQIITAYQTKNLFEYKKKFFYLYYLKKNLIKVY